MSPAPMKRLGAFAALTALAVLFACGSDNGSDPNVGVDAGGGKDAGKDARVNYDATPGDDDEDDGGGAKDGGSKDAGPKDAGDGGKADGGDAGADAGDAGSDAGDAGTDSGADGGSNPTPTKVWLSEVLADPPGTDGNNEFIELRCEPNLSLTPYWFVIVDGDTINGQPTNPGKVLFKKKLTGITCGAGGYVVLQRGGVYDEVATTTYVEGFYESLQNGAQTYLIVENDTFDPTDVDNNDDGTIDDAPWVAKVVDSVAVSDGDVGDKAYSNVVLSGAAVHAIARFSNRPERAAASWYFGAVKTNPNAPPSFIYDLGAVSPNFPAGGALTPGAANSAL